MSNVYLPFTRKIKRHGSSKPNSIHQIKSAEVQQEQAIIPDAFKILDIEKCVKEAHKYKLEFIHRVHDEIASEIIKHAHMGITQFVSNEFPLAMNCEDPNPLNKLSDEDARHIVKQFEEKGVNIKSRIDHTKKSVRFVIKIY